jgi:hypothetical protein
MDTPLLIETAGVVVAAIPLAVSAILAIRLVKGLLRQTEIPPPPHYYDWNEHHRRTAAFYGYPTQR